MTGVEHSRPERPARVTQRFVDGHDTIRQKVAAVPTPPPNIFLPIALPLSVITSQHLKEARKAKAQKAGGVRVERGEP